MNIIDYTSDKTLKYRMEFRNEKLFTTKKHYFFRETIRN